MLLIQFLKFTIKIGNSAEIGSNIFYYQNAHFKYTNNTVTQSESRDLPRLLNEGPKDSQCGVKVGWLVGCLRQYFSLYRAVSHREGERKKK